MRPGLGRCRWCASTSCAGAPVSGRPGLTRPVRASEPLSHSLCSRPHALPLRPRGTRKAHAYSVVKTAGAAHCTRVHRSPPPRAARVYPRARPGGVVVDRRGRIDDAERRREHEHPRDFHPSLDTSTQDPSTCFPAARGDAQDVARRPPVLSSVIQSTRWRWLKEKWMPVQIRLPKVHINRLG